MTETPTAPRAMSLGQAAKATGKSKTTIARAINSGRLSGGNRGSDGSYQIDPVELSRVFTLQPPGTPDTDTGDRHIEQPATPPRDPALQATIDTLERLIEEKDKTYGLLLAEQGKAIERLEEESQRWHSEYTEAKQKLLMLEAKPDDRGWFRRMLGRS